MKWFKYLISLAVTVPVLSMTAFGSEGANASAASIPSVWWIAPVGSILALVFAYYFYKKMMGAPEGNETMVEIATHVREAN